MATKGRKKKPQKNTFSETLVRLMDARKLSLRDITKATGIPASTLLSWRRGGTPSDFHLVARLAKFLNTSLPSLLGIPEEKSATVAVPEVSIPDALAALFREGQKLSGYMKYDLTLLTPKKPGDGGRDD